MPRLLVIFWLVLTGAVEAQGPVTSQVYVSDPLKWEQGDRPGQPAPRMAIGQVLLLEPDGMLAIVYGYLYRHAGQTHILYQEGYSVASGTWKVDGAALKVRYKLIYANVPKRGQEAAAIEESWKYVPATSRGHLALRIDASPNFVPLKNLADMPKLWRVIASHRQKSVL